MSTSPKTTVAFLPPARAEDSARHRHGSDQCPVVLRKRHARRAWCSARSVAGHSRRTQLEGDFLEEGCRRGRHDLASGRAAGEGDEGHVGVRHERLACFRAEAVHDVQHACNDHHQQHVECACTLPRSVAISTTAAAQGRTWRQPHGLDDCGQCRGGAWRDLRGLRDDGVAACQRRGDLQGRGVRKGDAASMSACRGAR